MLKTLAVVNLTVIVVAATAGGAALDARGSERGVEREAGHVWLPRGVDAGLRAGSPAGLVRVQVLAHAQPVMRAASRRGFRRVLESRVPERVREAARRSPQRITNVERRFARRMGRARVEAIRRLRRPARRAIRRLRPLRGAVRAAGGRIVGINTLVAGLTARLPRAALERLAARPDVQAILPEPEESPQLDIATQVIGAHHWWAAGHTGGRGENDLPGVGGLPVGAAVLGESPNPSHDAFDGVTIDNPASPDITAHGTRTAGIIGSQDETHRGVAYGVHRLIGAGFEGGSTWHENVAYAIGVPSAKGPGAAEPVQAMSQSSAGGVPPENDDVHAVRDVVLGEFALSLAVGAGNVAGTTIGNGYENGLVVGAIDDKGTPGVDDDALACFNPPTCTSSSSLGPTPGGRKKPDLVAPGQDIMSPTSGGGFSNASGTSFSTPMVGGALAILHGAGIFDPRAARALLINSARDWEDQENWLPGYGWGVLDLQRALAERAHLIASAVEGGAARFYSATVTEGAKATLAWERRGVLSSWPSPVGGVVLPRANLDLHQYRASDLIDLTPPAVDPGHGAGPDAGSENDTVEQVRAPAAGAIIYKVRAASPVAECLVGHPPCEGDETEPFALAATAELEELEPPRVQPIELSLSAQGTVSCVPDLGDVEVAAKVRNDSADLAADDATLSLALPEGVELVAGAASQTLSDNPLAPGATASGEAAWTVRATTSGAKQLAITGSGGTMGETFTRTETATFEANCAEPAALPVDVARQPSGTVECGTPVTIAARLRNPAVFDIEDARVRIEPGADVSLVEGGASQPVAGGTLPGGATSAEHGWVVRQDGPGDATATIVGEGVSLGIPRQDAREISLSCAASGSVDPPDPAPPAAPRPSSLDPDWLSFRRGAIVARGRVLAEGRPRGRVRVVARLPRRGGRRRAMRRRAIARIDGSARFRARLRVCTAGRWAVRGRYLGTAAHRPSRARFGTILIRRKRLRC